MDAPTPNWKGASWVFEKTRLISLFPTVNWERVTYLLYWSLRISVFALPVLLFIVSRIRKSRWSADHYPQVPQGLTTLPSDLPAPAVSVLGNREVGPQTYLSILVDMLQRGNLTITGGYGGFNELREYQSNVSLARQFEPDQPWEKEVYSALPFFVCLRFTEAKLRYAEVSIRGAAESHPHPSGRVPAVPGHF